MLITREFMFDSAHMLPEHEGKCSRLHGHTYRMLVTLEAATVFPTEEMPSSQGMLMDFGHLDKVVNENIVKLWDHRFLANGDEWPCIAAMQEDHRGDVALIGIRTTAENLAAHACLTIEQCIREDLFDAGIGGFEFTVGVTLYETPKSYASCTNWEAKKWWK